VVDKVNPVAHDAQGFVELHVEIGRVLVVLRRFKCVVFGFALFLVGGNFFVAAVFLCGVEQNLGLGVVGFCEFALAFFEGFVEVLVGFKLFLAHGVVQAPILFLLAFLDPVYALVPDFEFVEAVAPRKRLLRKLRHERVGERLLEAVAPDFLD